MKLGVALNKNTALEQIPMICKIGYDSYFISWSDDSEHLTRVAKSGAEHGLELTSLHAPFSHVNRLWEVGEEGDTVEAELARCIEDCARLEVPVLVSHPFIGFKDHTPTPYGPIRYRRLGELAQRLGVRIAIENVEGEEYLDALLPTLRDLPSIGFCLDTGHEMCYNKGRDMLADYGDMLCYLHINSNMGVTDPAGEITFLDDAHMLPFDGIADMEFLAKRLKKLNYQGHLTMELVKENRRDRTCNDIYKSLSDEAYFTEAYRRVARLADLIEKN
ncbi:MAG: sugar phosphate isomerase/epimerase [Clostridia bacterium]|nr:sugar phosphate isomerase/epimerase [Clostridia bacterium]